jgi:thymidylate synthase ThyX
LKIEFTNSEVVRSAVDVAVSSARTCYSSKGLVSPEASRDWARTEDLLLDIFKSGHHTTLQHTHITMTIDGVSRYLIWRLLHSHSFYNSEQVSQRYAKMNLENVYIPTDFVTRIPYFEGSSLIFSVNFLISP